MFQVKLEIGVLIFESGRNRLPQEKPLTTENLKETNSNLNPHMVLRLGIKSRPSAVTTHMIIMR